jgi:hypothetical protein
MYSLLNKGGVGVGSGNGADANRAKNPLLVFGNTFICAKILTTRNRLNRDAPVTVTIFRQFGFDDSFSANNSAFRRDFFDIVFSLSDLQNTRNFSR